MAHIADNFWGMNKKQRSCNGRGGGAQRPVFRVNEPKKKGARSARERTRSLNPLIKQEYSKQTKQTFFIGTELHLYFFSCV